VRAKQDRSFRRAAGVLIGLLCVCVGERESVHDDARKNRRNTDKKITPKPF